MEVDPEFAAMFEQQELDDLDASANTAYAVWADFRLAMVNDAWFRFARDNDADEGFFERWPIGVSLDGVFGEPGGEMFRTAVLRALGRREVQSFFYECSSVPTYRLMQVNILPFAQGACLLSHGLVVTSTHEEQGRVVHAPVPADYTTDDGLIIMCSGCRRTRRVDDSREWVWVPEFVSAMPPMVSHGLCAACKSYWMSSLATP